MSIWHTRYITFSDIKSDLSTVESGYSKGFGNIEDGW